ncbi:YfhO family protein [Staphylococcus simulans]|uniref:YfhO family protein n=1 Tax=Staphylococcus simulans TaxID=1286 RepID=UPI001E4193D2|nr:YfhO family protein [Staphylococcus simulans]MCD8914651.1 YfhO family protein [Staphylococcus simulans]
MRSNIKQNFIRFLKIAGTAAVMMLIIFYPALRAYMKHQIVFSGVGDGFRQMMPFQKYLYQHVTHFASFYDISFGLGGDYITDLAYYYSTSPLTYLNFFFVWLGEHLLHMNPSSIEFWPGNQLLFAIVKAILTFIAAYYMMRYFKLQRYTALIGTILYTASNVMLYFNFTWSFYGDVLIYLPITLLGVEKLFRERRAGWLIVGLALTLISNFYFSYYEAIIIGGYLIYRTLFQYKEDILTKTQKIYITAITFILSLMISSYGFYTGVSSFLHNDRKQNPLLEFPLFVDLLNTQKQTFLSGFHIILSILVIIALLQFKLYRHYYYRLFAIITWIFILGSFTNAFDSFFNGFSIPQRRWVYILTIAAALLVALMIQHVSEMSLVSLIVACIPAFGVLYFSSRFAKGDWDWWISTVLIIIVLAVIIVMFKGKTNRWLKISLVLLILLQQYWQLKEYKHNTLSEYETDIAQVTKHDYFSQPLNKKIKALQAQNKDDLMRIDYMSGYGLNSPFIYDYNGISLYSSIFDGEILKYYDKTMQINMPVDKNSTYRLFNNRANLMALWDVTDRFKMESDKNMPYGFEQQDKIKDKDATFIHSHNQIDYPAAHITNNTFNMDQLKSPLDKEQAMLTGVVWEHQKGNSDFKPNQNLLSQSQTDLRDAKQVDSNHIQVQKDKGGVTLSLPPALANQYQDMYVEMDVERISPSTEHYVKLNEYKQKRNELDYKYRRFVSPVTMRVKASPKLKLQLPKGKYRLNIKGIYGEDYATLRNAKKSLTPVKVTKAKDGLHIKKPKAASGNLVLPTAYRKGLYAVIDGKQHEVKQGNGIMTVIKTEKGQTDIHLKYQPPLFKTLILISIIGLVLSIFWCRLLSKHKFKS